MDHETRKTLTGHCQIIAEPDISHSDIGWHGIKYWIII